MKGEIYMISARTIKREKCKFCGKELEQKTMSFIVGDREFVLSGEPVRCDCMKAKIYWKKVDDRRVAIEYKREYNRKMMLRKRYYLNSKMNKRLMEYNFENYMTNNDNRMAYEKSKRYAEGFVKGDNKGSLFITGGVGTGKTHLAASIANYLIENEIPVIFGTLITLLNDIKDTYKIDGDCESDVIEKYSKIPMLIIDDLGKERPSEWTLEKLFTIVNNRYENNLPIIITTNYNKEKLRKRLLCNNNEEIVDSIISRLYEMCRGIIIFGKDKRKELV